MYQYSELSSAVLAIYEETKGSGEEPLWSPYGDPHSIPLLLCLPQHVVYVDSVFNSRKHLFPADVCFCWTAEPVQDSEGNEYFELLALKKTGRELPLNPTTVKTSDYYYNNRQGYKAVDIELTEPYAEEWARLTRDNISKSLAIVMDGKALMYPRVQAGITGGKLQITGDMDNDDLLLIKAAVSGGVLDCEARITKR
jgi:SecD/SecF fusion protein